MDDHPMLTTATTGEPMEITAANIEKAVKALREIMEENRKKPQITYMSFSYPPEMKDQGLRAMSVWGSIPMITSKSVPEGMIRVHLSDGTFRDYPIKINDLCK